MGEPALFLQAGAALVVERALVREQPLLPAGQEHGVEFEPLGGMQRHHRHRLGAAETALDIHHQRNMFEKALQVLELLHRADQFLQIFQPSRGVGGTVLLPHLRIAGFIEHDFGQLGVRDGIALDAPAVERGDQVTQRLAWLGLEFVGGDDGAGRAHQGDAGGASMVVQDGDGGIARARASAH